MSLQVLRKKTSAVVATKMIVRAGSSAPLYTERQAALGRPVSPHVTIYKFPITAVSSVSNRFTAIGMSAGIAAGSAISFIGGDIQAVVFAAQDLIPGFAPISKFFVAFPFAYHTLSAVRHVVWETSPQFINNKDSPKSSYALFGAATVFALGASAYTIKAPVEEKTQ